MKLHPPGDVDPIKSTIKVSKPTLWYGDVMGSIVTITLLDKDGNAPDAYRMARTTIELFQKSDGFYSKPPMRDGLDPVNVFKTVITPFKRFERDIRVAVEANAVRKADCNGNDANTVELRAQGIITVKPPKPSAKSKIHLSPVTSDDPDRNFKTEVTFTALDENGKAIPVDISEYLTIVAKDNYATDADANTILKVTAKDVKKGKYIATFNTTTLSEFDIIVKYKGDAIDAFGVDRFNTEMSFSSDWSAMEFIGADNAGSGYFTIKGKKAGDIINLLLTIKDMDKNLVKNFPFNDYTASFKVNDVKTELNFKSNSDGTYNGTYTLPPDAKPGSKYRFESLFFKMYYINPITTLELVDDTTNKRK